MRDATFCSTKCTSEDGRGKVCCETGGGHARLGSNNARIGPALELTAEASLAQLQLSFFEGSLAWKLRFHKLKLQFNCDVVAAMVFANISLFCCITVCHFPLKCAFTNASKSHFVWFWRRDQVLEQVLSQKRAEKS